GIIMHGIPVAHHFIEQLAQSASAIPAFGATLKMLASLLLNALAGVVSGALALAGVTVAGRIYNHFR
ncbi:MAG: DUF808 domain-containing protein, partial [Methylobacter sp.]